VYGGTGSEKWAVLLRVPAAPKSAVHMFKARITT